MKIKTEAEQKGEIGNCIVWAGIWLMMLYCMMYSTGCSTGGGRICFGYEEVNKISNSSGYDIPKKEGK